MKALDGINLLEFGSNLAAAYAAMLLAEQGALAVRVELPGASPSPSTPHFHVVNRSKRRCALDLAKDEGRAAVVRMIAVADIVICGLAPSRSRELGIDYESVRVINPSALYLAMPPLGSRGPLQDFDWGCDLDDELIMAISGISGSQWARSGNPVALTFPAPSYSTGVLGATAAVAALIARNGALSGRGQEIEVSVLAGALSLQTGSILRHEQMTTLYASSQPQDPLGPVPCYRLFEASDGNYLFVACGNSTFFNKFALAIERPELVSDPRFEGAPWAIPPENWQTLKDILEPIIRTKPLAKWLAILRRADVPCAPVMSRQEFIEDPQVRHLAMRRELPDRKLGYTIQMGVPVALRYTPGDIQGPLADMESPIDLASYLELSKPTARRLGHEHTDKLSHGPLSGVVVLDFASYIAGSYAPMILAQMGADVIKIESFEGDAFRSFGFGFLGWNQGKRGLAINLKSAEGREIVLELARRADVIVENMRPGATRKAGIDYETIAAINPRLVYLSVNAFGNHGPDFDSPGFDPLLQARSGVMAAQGGHHYHPVYLTCAICDYGAAMLAAFGCVLALRSRQQTGRGQMCETTLLQAAIAFQAGEFIFYESRSDMENGTPEYRGRSALSRAYRCSDGKWIALSVSSEAQWNSLRDGAQFARKEFGEALAQGADGPLASALADYFGQRERAAVLLAMKRARVPAVKINYAQTLFDDPVVTANGLIAELNHSQWGRVRQTGHLVRFSETPGVIRRAAPRLGEHSQEVLREHLRYDDARIASLVQRGTVKAG
jgi:crotonobetainyl-CoA:carnitine CoA-transferase CaiB-like acyl-CoA transferase